MSRQTAPEWGRALRRDWRHWREVVGWYVRGRSSSPPRVDSKAYHDLHSDLLTCCRALADADAKRRDTYAELEALVQPWITTVALEQADDEILNNLVRRCEEVDRELNGYWRARLQRGTRIILAVLLVGGGLGLLMLLSPSVLQSVSDALAQVWRRLMAAVQNSTHTQRLAVVGGLVALVGIFVVSRVSRG